MIIKQLAICIVLTNIPVIVAAEEDNVCIMEYIEAGDDLRNYTAYQRDKTLHGDITIFTNAVSSLNSILSYGEVPSCIDQSIWNNYCLVAETLIGDGANRRLSAYEIFGQSKLPEDISSMLQAVAVLENLYLLSCMSEFEETPQPQKQTDMPETNL